MNFWQQLQKPIMVLAPMADVTDAAFRRLIAKYGKPDVMWTEFVSADGLFLGPAKDICEQLIAGHITREEFFSRAEAQVEGTFGLIKDLEYTEAERPIVAQFFTSKPEMMRKAARLAAKLGFDGVDINMGCPDKSIEKQGAGAGLIKNPALAIQIIHAAKEGAGELPVSVKTRIGYNKNELETWLPMLLGAEPALITIHARTRKEMSLVPARWEHVARGAEIRDAWRGEGGEKSITLIFGNGDVKNVEHARVLAQESNADGVMLGRAIFGTPWLFSSSFAPSIPEKLRILIEHTNLFAKLLPHKSFAIMKKHFKAYVNGWDGAKELRTSLMECNSAEKVEKVIEEYIKTIEG
jgi:tRNA-dihydrouridine synthase